MKKIIYVDLDGVMADLVGYIANKLRINTYELNHDKIDEFCYNNPNVFQELTPVEGSVNAVNKLSDLGYDIYFLSTPMWSLPESFTGKRIWIERVFGDKYKKKLILTHRKDLNIGDYLIDDRENNGASKFKGELIKFGSKEFPNWNAVLKKFEK
jgi:5'-nucleotidase